MTSKHTPTPWKAAVDEQVAERGALYIEGPDGWDKQPIAHCDHRWDDREQDQANAALIVTAVNAHAELVAACEAFERMAADVVSKGATARPTFAQLNHVADLVRAALARVSP